jgi:thioredoxin reductase
VKLDPTSNAASFPPPRERYDVAVVGAGAAGCAEALAAAQRGARVLLADENPVAGGLIGLDVPLRYGGRATAAVQNPARMVERIAAATPLLAQAFDAGIDVRLGTCVWGAWMPAPASRALPGRLLGLADETGSSLAGFDELVVAAGARDLAIGFAGADLPGVVGARGFASLLQRYGAFAGRVLTVVGGGALAADCVALARANGLRVAAVVDLAAAPSPALAAVEDVRMLSGHVPLRAVGSADGVSALVVAQVAGGEPETISCDTVVLAVGVVPMVEIPAVLGCRMTFDAARGGHVPVLSADGRSSLDMVRVVGDAAGVACDHDMLAWMRALHATGGADVPACLCEEVSRGDLWAVRPPRYLGAGPVPRPPLDPGRAPNPDHLKRLTRAGMGVCQGRRCREQVAALLALDSGRRASEIPLASYRMPLRPLPLHLLAPAEEPEGMQENWRIWFDIPSMFTDHRDIPVGDEA